MEDLTAHSGRLTYRDIAGSLYCSLWPILSQSTKMKGRLGTATFSLFAIEKFQRPLEIVVLREVQQTRLTLIPQQGKSGELY